MAKVAAGRLWRSSNGHPGGFGDCKGSAAAARGAQRGYGARDLRRYGRGCLERHVLTYRLYSTYNIYNDLSYEWACT